ncbi:MAG: hypothetical protein ACF8QF_14195 [Phycisphaerales bacterium]
MRKSPIACAVNARLAACTATVLLGASAAAQDCAPAWDTGFPGGTPNGFTLTAAIASPGGEERIFLGGAFLTIGGISTNRIAQWDGSAWSTLGSGLNDRPNAMVFYDDGSGAGERLFVGGKFTVAGGVFAAKVGAWDGTTWSGLGSGLQTSSSAITRALAVHDDGTGAALYAGGVFNTAGGQPVSNIARWDGASWSALGPGLNGPVFALAVHDDGTGPALYAGGGFTATGDGATSLSSDARWDGSTWSSVGDELTGDVLAMTSANPGGGPNRLFIGGDFTGVAPGVSAVATLDGNVWAPLGTGAAFPVRALHAFDDGAGPALAAAGDFAFIGGVTARALARWDGAAWSDIGGSMETSSTAHALAFGDFAGEPSLIVGGLFDGATDNVARWVGCAAAGSGPDANGDGAVNGADLGLLLGAWGTANGAFDYNNDGTVDGDDLGVLLGAWTG